MVSTKTDKEVVRRLVNEMWSEGKRDVLDDIIHPTARPPHGREGYGDGPNGFKNLVSAWRTSFPDLVRTGADILADTAMVALHFAIRGTHKGAGGIVMHAPTGKAGDVWCDRIPIR